MLNTQEENGQIISEIPQIEEYPKILEAAQRGNLILFIGAGVSRVVGAPSWSDLAQKYLNYIFEEEGLINYSEYNHLKKFEPRKLLSICSDILPTNNPKFNLIKIIETEVKSENNIKYKKYNDVFLYLDYFKCPYITTNFDNFLEATQAPALTLEVRDNNLVEKTNRKIYHHFSELSDPSLLAPGDVVHIHGSLHDPNKRGLVLTIAEYFKAYSKGYPEKGIKSDLPDFLAELFKNKVVLFMGYGLEEYEILDFLVNTNKSTIESRHYLLYPFYREESNVVHLHKTYYKQLGVNLIPYSISKIGYSQLYYVIKSWSATVGLKSRTKSFIDNLATIDEVMSI